MDEPTGDRHIEDPLAVTASTVENLDANEILVDLELVDLEIGLLPEELVGTYFIG